MGLGVRGRPRLRPGSLSVCSCGAPSTSKKRPGASPAEGKKDSLEAAIKVGFVGVGSIGKLPQTMTAIEIARFGGPEVLTPVARPLPALAPDEVLIRVGSAGLNRGDLMQRMGYYPPPPGVTDIPGLEVAGHVAALGSAVVGWSIGDPVCALLAGGGYAEYAAAPKVQCLPLPSTLTMVEGGGLPETVFTCWTSLIDDGRLKAGETLLIHGGASGIGTMGIVLAKALGAIVFVTAGSELKCASCRALGADLAVDYNAEDFVTAVKAATGGRGVDVVLDMVAGDYLQRDMEIMAHRGRHVSIAALRGLDAQISVGPLLQKRLVLTGATLRGRTVDEKGAIAERLRDVVWPMIEAGRIKPVIHQAFPLAAADEAHRALESGAHVGKIVLTV
jgi:NADPH2:quinone reductase